jgi:TonB family protein
VHSDRGPFRKALEISLLVHLLLIFLILPHLHRVWPATSSVAEKMTIRPPVDSKPLKFELVELPDQRQEKPADASRAPASDLDRRAHGGEGEPGADRPGSRGNTPEAIMAEGGERPGALAPPMRRGRQQRPVPAPQPRPRAQPPRKTEDQERESVLKEGAGAPQPQPREQVPAIQLPPSDAWTQPPDEGGLRQSPDRAGGHLDTGALSFDTQWYDWGPYAAAMLRKIRRHWRIPELARLGAKGVVRIRFFIERDGTVTGLKIIDESGKPPMDFAARDAIGDSSPFDELPNDLTGVTREGVTISFYYNMNPPDRNY